ncbi:hypothetical protein M8C21_011320 [Ambrosia artemisiifolia]|uniref:Uncharacterized protein n=1 Tax=Ambrosia artemisiifolia TaxID=4212 RepID=A0AAD5GJJ4_AMBAR|nr:hypothetical protein M8C21_011320 [Ambrosia artemisiifolia]
MGFKGAMDIDFPTEVGPTEETVDALMEYLVGPLLPLKHTDFTKETPSESKQKSVAKQVHAAVVLYNYYHLNHNQESQFLKFDQFCKLATMLKPGITHHMKYTCQSDNTVLDDPENQLSITEKAIMDACTVSETLRNASAKISNIIKEWKVTKVAVLLIDSKKENCFLQFNNGVWSVIEKEVYPENKKRKKIMVEYDKEDLQKLAFLAVKEVAVYSLSQAKTATHFYIVQSTQKINEDNLVPIQDVISSLQGPVVKKCLSSWVITPVVEYYYLLPYAEILSKLFSRESNNLPHQIKDGSADVSINQGSQKSREKEKSNDSKDSNSTLKSNQRSTKESDQSKEVSTNLQKRSKLDSELVHISNCVKEEPTDSKDSKSTYKSNQCREKDSGESTEVSDSLPKKSKLDSECVHISNSVKEEPCDSKDSTSTYKYDQCEKDSGESKEASDNLGKKSKLDSEFVHIAIKEEPHDSKGTHTSNQCSEKENGQSKEVSDNLQETSKLDSETVHVSNSDKEEPHDGKASKNTYNSNQSSEKESGESEKVSDILQKKSKLESDVVHISSSSKEESHDSQVSKNGYESNQFGYTVEPVGKVADDAITSQFAARSVDQKVKESENSIGNSITVSNGSGVKQEDINGSCKDELNDSSSGASNKLENDKLLVCFQKENQNTKVQAPLKVYRHVKRSTPTKSTNSKVN